MRHATPLAILFATLLVVSVPSASHGQSEGQAVLDRATQAKLTADSFSEFSVVIDLLDEAIRTGLDESNTEFANRLLASTLVDRANMLSTVIFAPGQADPQVIGMIGIATTDLARAVTIDPKLAEAQFLLARLYAATNQKLDVAKAALTTIVEQADVEVDLKARAYSLRGSLQEDDKEKAVADFDEAVKLAPEDVEIRRRRGVFHLFNEEADKALADLDKAIELEPDYAPAYEARGLALTLKEEFGEAVKAFDEALRRDPEMTTAYSNRARAYALSEQTDKALEDLAKLLEQNPESVSTLLLRAQIQYSAGRPEEALKDVDRVLELRPGTIQAMRLRAELLVATDRVGEAIASMEQIVQAVPREPELLMQLGVYYMADEKPRKAIETFDQIIAIDDKYWQALRNRGDAKLSIAMHAEAIADYEKAIESQKESPGLLNNLAWVLATSPDDKLRDGKRAVELATKASELTDHKAGYILSTLAAAYAETGDFENARKWSTEAVKFGGEAEMDQLRKELESYRASKPWRELQNVEQEKEEAAGAEEPEEQTPGQTIDF
jgi:tetratricopeptide (TPR) repeat protein